MTTTDAGTLSLTSSDRPAAKQHREQPPRMRRRVGAVLAGLVAVVALSHGSDALLHATGVFPPYGEPMADALFVLALAYRSTFGIAGGYLAARLAPSRPLTHALVLGTIGFCAGLAGVVATWNAGPELGPAWYAILVMLAALPCAWFGGRVATRVNSGAGA